MKRIDIISDTHGRLSHSLLASLEGADLIIHAGDITSEADWEMLQTIAPIRAVLGNNDTYYYKYEPALKRLNTFEYEGLTFCRLALSRGSARGRDRRGRVRPHASGAHRRAGAVPRY